MIFNTNTSYGVVSRIFHWVVGVMIITMICAGYYMTNLEQGPEKIFMYKSHKATGFILLVLVCMRIIWNIFNKQVASVKGMPHWQVAASRLNFKVLYLLSIIMPFSGIMMTLYSGRNLDIFNIWTIKAFEGNAGIAELANEMHKGFVVLFIISISIHFFSALYHHFIIRDKTLIRMIKG